MRSHVLAQLADQLDELGQIAADGSRFALIAGGMVIAYRVTSKAHRDAIAVYKETAADIDARLDKERAEWAAREAALLKQLGYGASRETPETTPDTSKEGNI